MQAHESLERDIDSSADSTLVGLLILLNKLLKCYFKQSDYEDVVEFSKRKHFLHEFFYENLYYIPGKTINS